MLGKLSENFAMRLALTKKVLRGWIVEITQSFEANASNLIGFLWMFIVAAMFSFVFILVPNKASTLGVLYLDILIGLLSAPFIWFLQRNSRNIAKARLQVQREIIAIQRHQRFSTAISLAWFVLLFGSLFSPSFVALSRADPIQAMIRFSFPLLLAVVLLGISISPQKLNSRLLSSLSLSLIRNFGESAKDIVDWATRKQIWGRLFSSFKNYLEDYVMEWTTIANISMTRHLDALRYALEVGEDATITKANEILEGISKQLGDKNLQEPEIVRRVLDKLTKVEDELPAYWSTSQRLKITFFPRSKSSVATVAVVVSTIFTVLGFLLLAWPIVQGLFKT